MKFDAENWINWWLHGKVDRSAISKYDLPDDVIQYYDRMPNDVGMFFRRLASDAETDHPAAVKLATWFMAKRMSM